MAASSRSSTVWGIASPPWKSNPKLHKVLLSKRNKLYSRDDVKMTEINEKSSQFRVPFPIETVRCVYLKTRTDEENLEKNINSAYPVVHEYSLLLYSKFLNHQKDILKRELYQNMSLLEFVDRLLSKRAMAFVDSADHYLLRNGVRGSGNWDSVGTTIEKPPLTLDNYLSYDEIKLSALLSVSSHTYFVNDGARNNRGLFEEDRSRIEENGVIVGLIGARLEKRNVMEYREIVKSPEQNNTEFGYGSFKNETTQGLFLNFYGDTTETYRELSSHDHFNSSRFIHLGGGKYFDTLMFARRIILSIDTLLIEANDRAKKENKKAYIHVVGLGLGVWKICPEQDKIFTETFAKRLDFLGKELANVSDVCFAYIQHKMAGPYKHGDRSNNITIRFIDRNPHQKLTGNDKDKLLVVSYPWDGNAFPGNEFWTGHLTASGDPATACSTQIAELHNCYINGNVCGGNLRVATLTDGLVTFAQYQQLHNSRKKCCGICCC